MFMYNNYYLQKKKFFERWQFLQLVSWCLGILRPHILLCFLNYSAFNFFPQALVLLLSASDVMVLHCSLYALIGLAQRWVEVIQAMNTKENHWLVMNDRFLAFGKWYFYFSFCDLCSIHSIHLLREFLICILLCVQCQSTLFMVKYFWHSLYSLLEHTKYFTC